VAPKLSHGLSLAKWLLAIPDWDLEATGRSGTIKRAS
jgi:hypothetical protein